MPTYLNLMSYATSIYNHSDEEVQLQAEIPYARLTTSVPYVLHSAGRTLPRKYFQLKASLIELDSTLKAETIHPTPNGNAS
jgi:hypothetical protein